MGVLIKWMMSGVNMRDKNKKEIMKEGRKKKKETNKNPERRSTGKVIKIKIKKNKGRCEKIN